MNRSLSRRTLIKAGVGAVAAPAILNVIPVNAQSRVIKIGHVSPRTGPIAPFGEADPFILDQVQKLIEKGISNGGRTYPVRDAEGNFFANIPQCTRKDLRNAVEAAAKAGPGWAKRTAYNRGQILYRLGEMLEARRQEMIDTMVTLGCDKARATKGLDVSVDRLIYYAGWADKYEQVLGNVNPVASAHFNFTVTVFISV